MTILSGREIAENIKARQMQQLQQLGLRPKLAIIQLIDDPAIDLYVRIKQKYGQDIGAEVEVHRIEQAQALDVIRDLDNDPNVNGIIVQLPIADKSQQSAILNSVDLSKDVDGLAEGSSFNPATPTAIIWLLEDYHVDLATSKITVVGQGTLVGKPLTRMLKETGYDVSVADISTSNLTGLLLGSDVIITATGQPNLITNSMVKSGAVLVDAGIAVEDGQIRGDVTDDVKLRQDISITPPRGGVGPLTVAALFENVIKAAIDQSG